jgi:hypothetical protein
MKDFWLLLLGAAIGVVLKALVDPMLERRSRRAVRREQWLEDALDHADGVLSHIQAVRVAQTAELRFDGDLIARAVIRSLTETFSPSAIETLAEHEDSGDLARFIASTREAWMAVRIAAMDDQHGVPAAEDKYEPMYALQWYETALLNFSKAGRRALAH